MRGSKTSAQPAVLPPGDSVTRSEDWVVVIDEGARPGDLLPALAALLIDWVEKEQQQGTPAGAPQGDEGGMGPREPGME
jgi:hypothetical protein